MDYTQERDRHMDSSRVSGYQISTLEQISLNDCMQPQGPKGTKTLTMEPSNKTAGILRYFSCSHYPTAKAANTIGPFPLTADKAPMFVGTRAETDLVSVDWTAQTKPWGDYGDSPPQPEGA